MPPMHVFCRLWHFSSDDFVWLGRGWMFANFTNAIFCACIVSDESFWIDGTFEQMQRSFGTSVVASILGGFTDLVVSIISGRGAILESAKRAHLGCVLWLRMFLSIVQVVSVVLCTVAACMSTTLESGIWCLTLLVVVAQWSAVLFLLFSMPVIFSRAEVGHVLTSRGRTLVRFLGCCIGRRSSTDGDLQAVLASVDQYMGGVNASVTDIIAGQILIGHVQKAARAGLDVPSLQSLHMGDYPWGDVEQSHLHRSRGGALPGGVPITDSTILRMLFHNFCFASAVYGWKMFVLMGKGSMRGAQGRNWDEKAIRATLQEWPGHSESKLVFMSTGNKVKMPKYAIFVDPSQSAIVISIRGTLSMSDAVTDVLGNPVFVDDKELTGSSQGPHYVHSGMWESAKNVAQDLDNRRVLQVLLSGGGPVEASSSPLTPSNMPSELPDCHSFSLLVVGHSLGAGVAQLLTLLLRPRHPNVRCIGWGSPHPFSEGLADYMADCMTQVVCGDDIIARLSIRNAEVLRDRIIALTAHCHLPKHKLLYRGLCIGCNEACDEYLSREPISEQAQDALRDNGGKAPSPRFFHSGRIVYLRVLWPETRCCGEFDVHFDAEFVQSDDLMEMIISRKMMTHHMPDCYRRALEDTLLSARAADGETDQSRTFLGEAAD